MKCPLTGSPMDPPHHRLSCLWSLVNDKYKEFDKNSCSCLCRRFDRCLTAVIFLSSKSFKANLLMILVSESLILFQPSFSFVLETADPALLLRPDATSLLSKPAASSDVSSSSSLLGSSKESPTPNDSPCSTSSQINKQLRHHLWMLGDH
jgi:hypothetical protein